MKPWKAKSLLFFGTTIWGATFLFTTIGIQHCSASMYVVFRFVIALALCFIFFGKHIVKIDKKTLLQGGLLGVFFAIGFLFQTIGLKYTSIGNAAFITNLCVGITPFVYWFLTREKVKIYSKFAIIIGLIGVNIIADTFSGEMNFGDILIICSTFCWSAYMASLHIFTKKRDGIQINAQLTAAQFMSGIPIILIYFLVFELQTFYLNWNSELIISILFNAVMASFLVSFIQISVQRYTTPVNAVLIFALEPVFASIFAFLVLSEVLSINGYIGAAVMLFAIFVSDTLEVVINWIKKRT